ncbi:hypothetical protein WA026_013632 [Henosepilachna vigintioctopunctata]|uniref:Uncharacterized protein n=1 Tax=Henosepilachna vigintioctopunctata TaxID=420089 RepID=A0AAW1UTF5_9CUCU
MSTRVKSPPRRGGKIMEHSKGNTRTSDSVSFQVENSAVFKTYNARIKLVEVNTSTSTPSTVRPTPAQDAIKKEIDKRSVKIDLTERRKGSLAADGTEHE